jgi:hypothetical protein
MYISAQAEDFPNNESRVTFTLLFLKGTPLDWFQTELNHVMIQTAEFPKWFTSYTLFLSELQRLFGPCDPVNDAMTALEALRYKDVQKATRYTLEFNRHSRRTGWNEVALARLYYKGLPDRLKDEISRIGKPTALLELQDLVTTLDQRYWNAKLRLAVTGSCQLLNPRSRMTNPPTTALITARPPPRTQTPRAAISSSS